MMADITMRDELFAAIQKFRKALAGIAATAQMGIDELDAIERLCEAICAVLVGIPEDSGFWSSGAMQALSVFLDEMNDIVTRKELNGQAP